MLGREAGASILAKIECSPYFLLLNFSFLLSAATTPTLRLEILVFGYFLILNFYFLLHSAVCPLFRSPNS